MRVLIADDHDLVRDAVSRVIALSIPEAELASAWDAASAIDALRDARPYDLALIDWRMPGLDGLSGLRRVLSAAKEQPVAIFSGVAARGEIDAALKLGARGFVPKTLSSDAMLAAMRLMIAGERYIPAAWHDAPRPNRGSLTPAETEVLDQLFLGRSNKEIAAALGTPESSVKLRIRHLSRKLEARNRTEIVIRAMQADLGPDRFRLGAG